MNFVTYLGQLEGYCFFVVKYRMLRCVLYAFTMEQAVKGCIILIRKPVGKFCLDDWKEVVRKH
jgi:hypothetical protein